MDKKGVAVITKDKTLFELFYTEALYWGWEAKCFSTIHGLSEEFDKYFIDADTVKDDASFMDAYVVIMSSDFKTLKNVENSRVIKLPLSLSELSQYLSCFEVKSDCNNDSKPEVQFHCDKKARILYFGGKSVELSENEFLVLEKLSQCRGKAVGHNELNMVLGADKGNISDVYICYLRRKFETLCNNRIIKTVRSKGYTLDAIIFIK